jgi:hypothetical protein
MWHVVTTYMFRCLCLPYLQYWHFFNVNTEGNGNIRTETRLFYQGGVQCKAVGLSIVPVITTWSWFIILKEAGFHESDLLLQYLFIFLMILICKFTCLASERKEQYKIKSWCKRKQQNTSGNSQLPWTRQLFIRQHDITYQKTWTLCLWPSGLWHVHYLHTVCIFRAEPTCTVS